MLTALSSAITGLESYQEQMDVIGNNIANVDTTAFKAGVVDFADALSNTLQAPTGGTATTSGLNPVQIGTGVTITAISNNWNQGTVTSTNVESNLAITGNGFFMVRDTSSNAQFATRDGTFSVDANGYLVTGTGDRVQGFSNAGLSTLGDIKIDTTGMPATSSPTASVVGYTISPTGQVNVALSDGSTFVRGQVLMQNFQNPQALVSQGNNLYSNMSEAGALTNPAAAGTNGLGTITAGSLEGSNVDLSNEMANLIVAQRAFEANSKIVTSSDELLQTVVNMVH